MEQLRKESLRADRSPVADDPQPVATAALTASSNQKLRIVPQIV
jgi:hypothetical protein